VTGEYIVALCWIFGVTLFFPFFTAVRQLLEHRDPEVQGVVDGIQIKHPPYTRLFSSGPFSSTFGAAGFNRHLLHHWDAGISYTNFAVLESFLMQTDMKAVMIARHDSYWRTFLRLFRWS
jgi:hypothetical protein